MSEQEQEREAFEALASQNGRFPATVERKGDTYYNPFTAATWRAWQAARATPAVGAQERAEHRVLTRCFDEAVEMLSQILAHTKLGALEDQAARVLSRCRGHQAARSAAQGAVQVPAWQPIETASKDAVRADGADRYGKRVLVWWPNVLEPVCANWWFRADRPSCNFLTDGGRACYPTHWMPLPAAPAHAGERSEGGA